VGGSEFPGRKSSQSGDAQHGTKYAGLEVREINSGHVLAARGLVVKHVGAVELRVVDAALLAAAAYAVLVAHSSQTWCPCGYRTGPPVCAQLARRSSLEAVSTQEKKTRKFGGT
jgi:hypothetical protein